MNSYQLLAERLLGRDEAHRAHKELYTHHQTTLPIVETDGVRRPHTVMWQGYPADFYRQTNGTHAGVDYGWTHLFTDYRQLWHVELRHANKRYWKELGDTLPSPEEFLWQAIAMLVLENPYELPGVSDLKCISFFPTRSVEA